MAGPSCDLSDVERHRMAPVVTVESDVSTGDVFGTRLPHVEHAYTDILARSRRKYDPRPQKGGSSSPDVSSAMPRAFSCCSAQAGAPFIQMARLLDSSMTQTDGQTPPSRAVQLIWLAEFCQHVKHGAVASADES